MSRWRCIILMILATAFVNMATYAQPREEFNGPMPGWANLKTRFKAKGDGKSDDTRAFQLALDSLTCQPIKYNAGKSAYTVIYLPKGRYRIANTLLLRGKIGIAIIGEDPQNTIIEWAGGNNDTMLWANGSSYFKISRINWQANNKTGIEAIGIHWKDTWNTGTSRSFAPLNIEISDCFFRDLAVGIGGGYKQNDSEVTIRRCEFYNCSEAGIYINSHNALDYWIWYCKFINCEQGIYNSRGNYHVYNSYFSASRTADVMNSNGYYTSVRGCFSEGSTAFSIDKGVSSNPFKRIFQDNVVKKPKQIAVMYHHTGKPVMMGNTFDKATDDTIGKAIRKGEKIPIERLPFTMNYASWAPSTYSILSIDNHYFYRNPFNVPVYPGTPTKHYVINDSYGKPVELNASDFLKKMPGTPQYVKRTIITISPGSGTDAIQAAINRAAKLKGQRPIVYFPYGIYEISRTIVVPAGSDMQIIGDGMRYSTTIRAANQNTFKSNCFLRILGPTTVEIRDLQFGTASSTRRFKAIEFDNIDQQGSYVHIDQLYSVADNSLVVDKIDYTVFEKNNSFFSDGNIITGGSRQKAGRGTTAVYCFGGSYSKLKVSNNVKFVSKDCWWEGAEPVPVNLTGDGDVTIDGTKIAPRQADSMPIVKIDRFKGKIALMNAYIQGGIELSRNNPSLSFLLWNSNFYYKKDILGTIPRGIGGRIAYAGITSQCFYTDDPDCKMITSYDDKFVNIKDEKQFLNEMTSQTRNARPQPYINLPKGVSNIYISRVTLDSFTTGLYFEP